MFWCTPVILEVGRAEAGERRVQGLHYTVILYLKQNRQNKEVRKKENERTAQMAQLVNIFAGQLESHPETHDGRSNLGKLSSVLHEDPMAHAFITHTCTQIIVTILIPKRRKLKI